MASFSLNEIAEIVFINFSFLLAIYYESGAERGVTFLACRLTSDELDLEAAATGFVRLLRNLFRASSKMNTFFF